MSPLVSPIGSLPVFCRGLLQIGFGLALQTTLLLGVGLLAGWQLRRWGPAAAGLAYKATLLSVIVTVLLSGVIGGRYPSRWAVSLPAAGERPGDAAAIALTPVPLAWTAPPGTLTGGPGLGLSRRPAGYAATFHPAAEPMASPLPAPRLAPEPRVALPLPSAPLPFHPSRFGEICVLLVALWGCVLLFLLAGLLHCYRSLGRLRMLSAPVAEDTQELLERLCAARGIRPPLLRASAQVHSPVLIGLRRPAILLPARYDREFGASGLRAVLIHELAHLERRDCAWLLLVRVACAIGWVQPLLWALARRLEENSEEVCDREVLQRDVSAHAYARCLVDLAERLVPSRAERALGAGMASGHSALERRVRGILTSSDRLHQPLTARLRVAVTLGMLAAVAAGLTLVSSAAAPLDGRANDPLADDARLAQQVRVTVEGLPAGDLLSQLSAKTGIALAAEPDIGDDKVIAFGPARPLRELLADLAALFNDRWEKQRDRRGVVGYRLIRTVSARQLEATFAHRTTEQLMARLERAVTSLEMKPEELGKPENREFQWYASDPKRRFALGLYRQLSRAQREALFQTESLRIPFRFLSPAQQEAVRAMFGQIIADEQAFSDERAKQLPPELALSPPAVSRPADLETGEIRFQLMHVGGDLSLNLQFGKRLSPGIFITSFSTADRWLAPARGNPYTGEPVSQDVSLPPLKATRAALQESAWPDRLRRLAEGSGRPVMGDYYRVPAIAAFPLPPQAPASAGAPAALDALCAPEGYLWWVRGQTLLLRKRDWFNQRRYEVPDRWLLDVARRASHAPLTGPDVARVLDLTDDQIIGLNILASPHGYVWQFNRAEEVGGLREYLAIVNAAPRKSGGQIENTQTVSSDVHTGQGYSAKYDGMTPLQRRLAPVFIAAQDYPISSADPEQFRLFLFRVGNTPMSSIFGYKYFPFRLAWDTGGKEPISLGYSVSLPASLPNDRRDRTSIEVLPRLT